MADEIAKSMQGKHDLQLERELRQALKANGSLCDSVQIERRRGFIKVKFIIGEVILIKAVIKAIHPEFDFSKTENGYMTFRESFSL